jgi:hypothetical protein
MIKKIAIIPVLVCCVLSGCAGLMLEERKRALDESFEKGKINKVQYNSMKKELERKGAS